MAKTFISYSRQDDKGATRANDLREIVRRNSALEAWLDVENTPGSQDWSALIEAEIKRSALFILILTPGLISSRFVPQEIEWAKKYNIPILPVQFNVELSAFRNVTFYDDIVRRDVFSVGDHFHVQEKKKLFTLIQKEANVSPVEYEPPHDPIVLQPPGDGTGNESPDLEGVERDSSVLSFVNFRGGVGKTTLCALAGIWLARNADSRVLIVDLDPQENVSDVLGAGDALPALADAGRTALSLFEPYRVNRKIDPRFDYVISAISADPLDTHALGAMPTPVLGTGKGGGRLDLLAGDRRMTKLAAAPGEIHDLLLDNFKTALAELRKQYDRILIDCGPAASLLSQCAILSAGTIVAPARAQHTSTRGLCHMMEAARTLFGEDARAKIRPVFNMARRHVQYERDYLEMFNDDPGKRLSPELAPLKGQQFESVIPLTAALTDPIRVVRQVLASDGSLKPLGAAQAAVDAFCRELSPPAPVFEENQPDDNLFGPDTPEKASEPDSTHQSKRIEIVVDDKTVALSRAQAEELLKRLRRAQGSDSNSKDGNLLNIQNGTVSGSSVPEQLRVTREIQPHLRRDKQTADQFRAKLSRIAMGEGLPSLSPKERTAPEIARWLLSYLDADDAIMLVKTAAQSSAVA
ncbi:MAG: AAA family ATPase [Pseudomonadota bacterium]